MRILIVTDAWRPQTNGVVRTYEHLSARLAAMGHDVRVIGPHDFPWRFPMPGYAEIELALFPFRRLARMIGDFAPDTIHVGTEGPLGQAARRYCIRRNLPFTTCYHTQFPDYAAERAARFVPFLSGAVRRFFIARLRRFHAPSAALMAATDSLRATLRGWGFGVPMRMWTRGVDIGIFTAEKKTLFGDLPGPVAIFVGRVAVEKNLEAFLSMPWPGSKVVTGDGPDRERLMRAYPGARFTGAKKGRDLAAHYQSADVFVFPSRTDTFGMVIVEALSCGLPVAAYPVTGPADIVTGPMLGALDGDLGRAALRALDAPGDRKGRHDHVAARYTWDIAAQQFLDIVREAGAVFGES